MSAPAQKFKVADIVCAPHFLTSQLYLAIYPLLNGNGT